MNDRTLSEPEAIRVGTIIDVLEEGKVPHHRALNVASILLAYPVYVTNIEL
jgi:hypothetical protein